MKKVLFLVLLFVLAFQVPAFAETKIGVISLQRVVRGSEYGKEMMAKLKAKFEPMQKELEREANEIKKLENELKNQDLALKLEAKQDRQREYRRKVRDHQDSVQAFRQKSQAETQRLQKPITEKVIKTINEYGKKNGYTLILEGTGIVMYFEQGIDVTEDIITDLDKLKKAGK